MPAPISGELLENIHDVYHNYMGLDMTQDQVFELYKTFNDTLKDKISNGINVQTRIDIMNDLGECIVGRKYPSHDDGVEKIKQYEKEMSEKCKDFGYTYIG